MKWQTIGADVVMGLVQAQTDHVPMYSTLTRLSTPSDLRREYFDAPEDLGARGVTGGGTRVVPGRSPGKLIRRGEEWPQRSWQYDDCN